MADQSSTPSARYMWPALAVGGMIAAGILLNRRQGAEVNRIPRDHVPDSTLALLRDGYEFIPKRCARLETDIFETRLMLQKAICMQGEDAARLFYDTTRFHRHHAAPRRLKKTLFGTSGIQSMDGEAHRQRKELFMSLMTPERIGNLAALTVSQWEEGLRKWAAMDRIILHHEARDLLCRAVCAWAGVPLKESEVRQRANEFEAMIDSPGRFDPRHLQGRMARRSSEKWIAELIEAVRDGEWEVDPEQALHAMAWHRDLKGKLLKPRVAAVALINVLRPTVAISRYVVFMALALEQHPEWRERLRSGEDELLEMFVQEVRRMSPFFPFVPARVSHAFDWKGYHFPKRTRVILDLYGTNRDPRIWEDPDDFRPERFRNWDESPYNFIPQGGGDYLTGHRCAGEWITIELMKTSLAFLVRAMDYDVPRQNLRVRLSRMPAIPQSRFIVQNVRAL